MLICWCFLAFYNHFLSIYSLVSASTLLKVLLKPHIDLAVPERYRQLWRGDIGKEYKTEKQWDEWFASYEEMIVKYASLAETLNVEMFSISCELINTSKQDSRWRNVIQSVRKAYSGPLVDSANHDGEEYEKTWWDAVDYIGVDAYYLPILKKDYDEEDRYRYTDSVFYEPPNLNVQKSVIRNDKYKKSNKRLFLKKPTDNKNLGSIKFSNSYQKHDEDKFEPTHVQSFIRREEDDENMIRLEIILLKDGKRTYLTDYFKLDGLIAEIIQFLVRKKNLISKDDIKRYRVYKDDHELDSLFSLDEYNIHHGDRLTVSSKTNEFTETKKPVNQEVLPKRSQKYTLKPSYSQIELMTEEELKAVPNFTVIDKHATLEFDDPVDLRNLDIDKVIKISHKMVEVYPEAEFGDDKPKIGEKLNRSAFITFNDFKLNKQNVCDKFVGKLREMAASMNATLVGIDQKNDTVKIYIEHF